MHGLIHTVSFILLFMLVSLININVQGQTQQTSEQSLIMGIPVVSLIDFAVNDNQMITYGYSSNEPNNVEQIITPNTKDNTWINYSSIVNSGSTNYITVNISSGSLPADVSLKIIISEDAGMGSGTVGTPIGEITLTSFPQNIIVNIGSCFTGYGVNSGHRLTYVWENPESYNYSNSFENGEPIAVTYTITSTE